RLKCSFSEKKRRPRISALFIAMLALGGRRRLDLRLDADLVLLLALVLELHHPIHEREDRVIRAHADVAAGMPLGAVLTDDDVAGDDLLAAELLHTLVFGIRIAAVPRRADALFMSHDYSD